MSLGELGIRMGIYRQREVISDRFRDSLIGWPEGVTPRSYSEQIFVGTFDPSKHKRSTFPDLYTDFFT